MTPLPSEEQESESRIEQEHSPEISLSSESVEAPDIAHPESLIQLQSRPGQISSLVKAGRYRLTLDKKN